ncbi:MAG: cysteine hydrolase [Desulfobacterales bacterium]|jgi:nicotinamidase-related amidase|nr:cysteine hydrolase [Desulfobacterales bacterium]
MDDKIALILVDIQNDYFPGGKVPLDDAHAASVQAARLLGRFREKGWPVLHIRHLSIRPGATFFLPDTPGSEIHPSVAPREDEAVIVKHFPNSFRETSLLDQLREAGAASLVVCGAMSHMCIDATVRAASDLGFQCRVAQDACATHALTFGPDTVPAAKVHAAFMAALSAAYAEVLSTEALIQKIP